MTKFFHTIALIAFLGSIIAPACGFAWGSNGSGKYSVVEICTSQGIESRIVENEDDSDTPSHQMVEQCQFCFANANMLGFLPDTANLETIKFVQEKLKFQAYEVLLLSRLNLNTAPRGPPALI